MNGNLRNTSRSFFLTYKGKTKTLPEFAEDFNIKNASLWARLKRGWSVERALETPIK